jgi:hypothetical protein
MTAPSGSWSRVGATLSWLSDNPVRRSLVRVMAYVLATRLVLALVSYVTVHVASPQFHPKAQLLFREHPALAAWMRWDAGWYLAIVQDGYFFRPGRPSNVAFLPAFPALIELARPIFGQPIIAGLVVANLATLAAIVALWAWVRERAGLVAAERAVLWLLVYPFSFFLHSIYAEGFFFLVCVLALRDADRKRWLAAAFWACVAALTRPMGIMLVPAMLCAIAWDWRAGQRPHPAALAVLVPCVVLGMYVAHLWVTFESPFVLWQAHTAGWKVQANWNLPGYWRDVWVAVRQRDAWYLQVFDAAQVLLLVPLVALTIRAWKRLGAGAGVYASFAALLGIVFGPDSLGREVLAVVPVFAALGTWQAPRWLATLLWACSFALLCVFTFAFVKGRFLG